MKLVRLTCTIAQVILIYCFIKASMNVAYLFLLLPLFIYLVIYFVLPLIHAHLCVHQIWYVVQTAPLELKKEENNYK